MKEEHYLQQLLAEGRTGFTDDEPLNNVRIIGSPIRLTKIN